MRLAPDQMVRVQIPVPPTQVFVIIFFRRGEKVGFGKIEGVENIARAKRGELVPVYQEISVKVDALNLFEKISNNGCASDCLLLESADVVTKYGEKSVICVDPCVKVKGFGTDFELRALNFVGEKFLSSIKRSLGFCELKKVVKSKFGVKSILGRLVRSEGVMSEEERLRASTHADVFRRIAFHLKPSSDRVLKKCRVFGGLFGVIGYDFIDQFECLPKNKLDLSKDPDYELNFYDSVIVVDHKNGKVFLCSSALIFCDEDKESEREKCLNKLRVFKSFLSECSKSSTNRVGFEGDLGVSEEEVLNRLSGFESDLSEGEFSKVVLKVKEHILKGDVFQVVVSRNLFGKMGVSAFEVYKELVRINPSPYMFYFKHSEGVLVGSSPETFIKVELTSKGFVLEIRPIAGTKPRGFDKNGFIDEELDSRFEADLRNDVKELAEHTMLIDLARNDVARVSKPGTRVCKKPYMIEKYSHVQHMVSVVKGVLKDDLDALHAYLASMNMGTLTGAPKVEAMKLIRLLEKSRRGFYGGSIGYLTPFGEFDSAIVIRSLNLKNGLAFVRAGAGVVLDSVPREEFFETQRKAMACVSAVLLAEKRVSGKTSVESKTGK